MGLKLKKKREFEDTVVGKIVNEINKRWSLFKSNK